MAWKRISLVNSFITRQTLSNKQETKVSYIVDNHQALKLSMGQWHGELEKSMHRVWNMIHWIIRIALLSTALIILFLVPFYVTTSLCAGVMTYQYAWTVSAAFLRGLPSVVAIETSLLLLIPVVVLIYAVCSRTIFRYLDTERRVASVQRRSINNKNNSDDL